MNAKYTHHPSSVFWEREENRNDIKSANCPLEIVIWFANIFREPTVKIKRSHKRKRVKLNKPIRGKETKIRKTKKPIKNRSRPRKRFDDRNQKYQNLWKKVKRAINVLVNSSFLTTAAFARVWRLHNRQLSDSSDRKLESIKLKCNYVLRCWSVALLMTVIMIILSQISKTDKCSCGPIAGGSRDQQRWVPRDHNTLIGG